MRFQFSGSFSLIHIILAKPKWESMPFSVIWNSRCSSTVFFNRSHRASARRSIQMMQGRTTSISASSGMPDPP